jgi:hypothetical protein
LTKKIASILVLCLQLACGVLSTPEPTATPQPTSTSTPVPTATATSTPTPEVTQVDVPKGGFSLLVPDFLDVDVQDNTVGIFDEELIVTFSGTPYLSSTNTLEDVIDDLIDELSTDGSELIKDSESLPISVNGIEGIAIDLTGNLFGAPIDGQAIAFSPKEDFVIFGLGVSNLTSDDRLWQESGSIIFQGMLDSMTFTDAPTADVSSGACEISTDSTYGYTETNPIEVGGDFLEGPARERAYLDNLLGPNGESLSYERQGSLPTDTTIVDIYLVTGSGINETLYLDEYNYSEPQAPVGFTCKGEFPLTAP